MSNTIHEATRISDHSSTLIDPIAVSIEITTFTSGIFKTPSNISDHFGTYIYIKFVLTKSSTYKRKIWSYKRANFDQLFLFISIHDWSFIQSGSIHEACDLFCKKLIELAELCIPRKEVTIRPHDKPWYDSEIRRTSRKRDRQKQLATKSHKNSDWILYKKLRNKVNNLKKHAKVVFFKQFGNYS